MKSCHVKCSCILIHSVLSRAASCFQPLSRWCPRHVPYWSGDGNKRLLPDSSWEVGMDWIRRLDSNRMEPLECRVVSLASVFSPGNKVRQGGSESLGTGQQGERTGRLTRPGRLGRRERVNYTHQKSPLIAHKTWGKSVSHILFFLKTDTCKTLCLSQNRVSVKKCMLTEEGIWGEYP